MRVRTALLLAVALASPTLAIGERAASAQTGKAASDQRARELFTAGDKAYAEARYEDALASFQEAYQLSQRPQLLFNVANALERLGRYAEAADALDKYLASGKAKDKETVQARLANLKKRVDEQKKADEEKAAREAEERKKAEEADRKKNEKEEEARRAREEKEKATPILPWALVGGGGVLVVTGAVFGVVTLGARSDAKSGCTDAPSGHLCNESVSSAISREKTFGIVADVSVLAGLVLGGVGAYMLLAKPKETTPRVQVGLGRVDLVGRF